MIQGEGVLAATAAGSDLGKRERRQDLPQEQLTPRRPLFFAELPSG